MFEICGFSHSVGCSCMSMLPPKRKTTTVSDYYCHFVAFSNSLRFQKLMNLQTLSMLTSQNIMAADLHVPVMAQSPTGQAPANSVEPKAEGAAVDVKPKAPRPRKPNYALIHSQPLPVQVFPLPAFIPHNPLSIVRIAIAMISHTLWPPSSLPVIHKAYFSADTQSIHVTDPQSIRALWEQGFFGSGSLSRSEPRWLDQEKRKRGIQAMQTSEEVTAQRRRERRQFKLERARLEAEAVEMQRRLEGQSEGVDTTQLDATDPVPINIPGDDIQASQSDSLAPTPAVFSLTKDTEELDLPVDLLEESAAIEEQEHLQLTLEESFFLTYVLGALEIPKDGVALPSSYLFRLYCANSNFPVPDNTESILYNNHLLLQTSDTLPENIPDIGAIAPDNAFVLRYVVFHHFRSLGWVVRPGIKFAVDYLLYNRGPAFSHAEFAIMILPTYSHPYWSETNERREECKKKESRDWWWLHRVNRVQGLAHKTMVLVYVEVPPPWDVDHRGRGFELDVGSVLKRYKVREFAIGRWTPNRHR